MMRLTSKISATMDQLRLMAIIPKKMNTSEATTDFSAKWKRATLKMTEQEARPTPQMTGSARAHRRFSRVDDVAPRITPKMPASIVTRPKMKDTLEKECRDFWANTKFCGEARNIYKGQIANTYFAEELHRYLSF